MTDRIRITGFVGASPGGTDQAIRNVLQHAGQTVRNINWREVTQTRGHVNESQLEHSRSPSRSASGGTMASDLSPRTWRSHGIGLGSAVRVG